MKPVDVPLGVASPIAPAAGCFVYSPQPLPSPLPASAFTFEISSFDDPFYPITPALDAVKQAGQSGVEEFERDILVLNLTSESYLAPILAKYDVSVTHQYTVIGPPLEVHVQTGPTPVPSPTAAPPTPAPALCPSYLVKVNHPDTVDLSDLPTWAGKAGVSGHLIFLDHAAAALFKLSVQIRIENPTIVSVCSVNAVAHPAFRVLR